jgi:hypothetical protein
MGLGGTYEYTDDILAPMEEIEISYNGKNPFLICSISMKLMRDIMKISASNLREDDVRWDVLGDPKGFYAKWRADRKEDTWTKTYITMIAQGVLNKERTGTVVIRIRGKLTTKYKYSNPISKIIWRMYSYLFYYRQRRAYLDLSRDHIMQIRQEILSAYNILKEERWGA